MKTSIFTQLGLNPTFFKHYTEKAYMLWPSSWNFLEGELQDTFGVLICTEQDYTTSVIVAPEMRQRLLAICEQRKYDINAEEDPRDIPDFYPYRAKGDEEFNYTLPCGYSFHEFDLKNNHLEADWFEPLPNAIISDATEIYRFKPKSFKQIQEREFDHCEEQKYLYYTALSTPVLKLDLRNYSLNVEENQLAEFLASLKA